jgi:hypothetical protein
MRPFLIVIQSPGFNNHLGVLQTDEDIVVQALIPEYAVKTLDERILSRFTWLNIPDLTLLSNAQRSSSLLMNSGQALWQPVNLSVKMINL